MNKLALAFFLLPNASLAGGIQVEKPMVPLAPPGAMAHAAYLSLTNVGAVSRHLIGVTSQGHAMAHFHVSKDENGFATMSTVDMIELEPGQTVVFEPGGLHIMLIKPMSPLSEGDGVVLTLEFANGEQLPVTAEVRKRTENHKHGHGHAHSHGS